MRGSKGVRQACLCLALLLLCCFAPGARGEEETAEAKDLSPSCVYTYSGSTNFPGYMMFDGRSRSAYTVKAGEQLLIRCPEEMGTLFLRLSQLHSLFTLWQRGERGLPLKVKVVDTAALVLAIPLEPGCRTVCLQPFGEDVRLCEARIYGPGTLPESVPQLRDQLEKTDFLLVATHPDDEWVFLGAVYPLYGHEQGYTGTVVYMTLPNFERAHECVNSLWVGGFLNHPYFLGFPDIPQNSPRSEKNKCKQEDVTLSLVRLYRRIRPLVVVTQDPKNGEYGHWQHKMSANAAFDAVSLAADPDFDPESAAAYGVWTVQKVYQHFAQGISTIDLPIHQSLGSYGGRSALEVARKAFQEHKTQLKTPFRPGASRAVRGDIRQFGLTWSTLGPDTQNDMFEHIDPKDLVSALTAPSPEPEPSLEPSPEATPTPDSTPAPTATPEPTPGPTKGPVPDPTLSPELSLWDKAAGATAWAADRAALLAGAVVALLAASILLRQLRRARRRHRQ